MLIPPRTRPPIPTRGFRAPTTVASWTPNVDVILPQRAPGPIVATFLSADNCIWLIRCKSSRIPWRSTLDHPGLGEWPPLRTANGTRKKAMILRALDTSLASRGKMMQCGNATQVSDLLTLVRQTDASGRLHKDVGKEPHQFSLTNVWFKGDASTWSLPRDTRAVRQAMSSIISEALGLLMTSSY